MSGWRYQFYHFSIGEIGCGKNFVWDYVTHVSFHIVLLTKCACNPIECDTVCEIETCGSGSIGNSWFRLPVSWYILNGILIRGSVCMKNKVGLSFVLVMLILLVSCQSTVSVDRLSSDTDIDLSGNWNDTDIRIVASALVKDSLGSPWIDSFRMKKMKNPVVIVGSFLNRSSEHIDTSIISKRYEIELINSGKVDMVADIAFRASVRDEREEQQYFASESTAKALGKEIGADFLLQGSVRTNLDQVGGKSVRTYYVSAELINIETNQKVWVGEETIKKMVKQSKYKF